ncbi:hypothetical protein [Ktedonobacter racemifer]|uniref:hypothetical protein n=1 Tax=Ktedonobacter racemifer TaxID=363277 RepID=UPI00058F20AB|nr:hypothetical protein [Ktedonobacter racemifer]
MGSDDSLPGKSAPHGTSFIDILSIGDVTRTWLELDRKSRLDVSRVCLFRHTQACEKERNDHQHEATTDARKNGFLREEKLKAQHSQQWFLTFRGCSAA